ncbi:MAG: hypothetical protein C0402_04365 [Thermodesulfovibrio sp.]|nr:hypothetical protein [Thermodesulfovibrio sp.]
MSKLRKLLAALIFAVILCSLSPFNAEAVGNGCSYFSEDFSGSSGRTWTSANGVWNYLNQKLDVEQITSGKTAYAETLFYPYDFFTIDANVEVVSLSSDGAYGIYPRTTGDVYLTVDGRALAGVGVIVFASGNAYLTGWDVVANTWYKSAKYSTGGAVSSIGVAYSADAITLRINGQDTPVKFTGDFSGSFWPINDLWLTAQGDGTHMRFDNICSEALSVDPVPATPQNMRYTLSGKMLTINWDAAAGASGYKIGVGLAQAGIYENAYDVGNTTQIGPVDVSALSGTFYLAVKAYNSSTESGYSNGIGISFAASVLPAPQNMRYNLSGKMLTINWDAAAGASGYKIGVGLAQAGIYENAYDVGNTTQIGPADVSALSGTYYLAVKAYDATRESAYSNGVTFAQTFTIMTNPTDSQLFTARGSDGTIVSYSGTRDGNGIPTDMNLIQVMSGDGSTTQIELDSAKRPVKLRSPDGVIFDLEYFGGNQVAVTAISPDGSAVVNTGFQSSATAQRLPKVEAQTLYAQGEGNADWIVRVTQCGQPVDDALVSYSVTVPGWTFSGPQGGMDSIGGGNYVASIPTGLKPSLTTEKVRAAAETVAGYLGFACDVLGIVGSSPENSMLLASMCPAIAAGLTVVTGPGGVAIGTACQVVTRAVILYCIIPGNGGGPIGTGSLAEQIFQGLQDPKVFTSNITLRANAFVNGIGDNTSGPVEVPSNGPFPTTTIPVMLPDYGCDFEGKYSGDISGAAPGTITFRVSDGTLIGTISGTYAGDSYSGRVGGTVSPEGVISGTVSGAVTWAWTDTDGNPRESVFPFSGNITGMIVGGTTVTASGSWHASDGDESEMGSWNANKLY